RETWHRRSRTLPAIVSATSGSYRGSRPLSEPPNLRRSLARPRNARLPRRARVVAETAAAGVRLEVRLAAGRDGSVAVGEPDDTERDLADTGDASGGAVRDRAHGAASATVVDVGVGAADLDGAEVGRLVGQDDDARNVPERLPGWLDANGVGSNRH